MKEKLIISFILFSCFLGCTTINVTDIDSDKKITEYYIGLVKVVSPAVYAPKKSIRFLEVENYGFWASMDNRPYIEEMTGVGLGLGYRHIDRQNLPLDCQLVIKAKTKQELEEVISTLNVSDKQKESLCVAIY